MERAVAIRKLTKLLGKKFGYQFDKGAPSKEEREAARAEIKDAAKARDAAVECMSNRSKAVLDADAEYQAAKAVAKTARERLERLNGIAYRDRISVGTSNSLFFRVEATGDSWEEVINKIETRKEVNK